MANFLPALEHAEFRSEGEFTLFQELAALDDEFTVIHSMPWLRGKMKRIYSQELHKYLKVPLARKHLSGEVDFVILHAEFGMLCIETKSGQYIPSGVRFIHEHGGYEIDPLNQVRDNTFVILEMLNSWQMKCPVGYAVHFPDLDLDGSQIASAYIPTDYSLSDGILIMQKHRREMAERIIQLMQYWKVALKYGSRIDFSREINRFVDSVWPHGIRSKNLGKKIVADGELWLRLDDRQANQVDLCLNSDRRLIAGFSGSGKTLIARSLAEELSKRGFNVIFLLKNRQITQKVATQLSHLGRSVMVQTFHAYCESIGLRKINSNSGEKNYDEHYLALRGKVDHQYDVLIVDEAQALNEADHLALRKYFSNARQFLFADELQVLPGIEKGSSYRFLEDTYCEKFFYLTTVYRNPGFITKVIKEMLPPRHEVNCNRQISEEDLSKTVSRNVSKSIKNITDELLAGGVRTKDIIVLSQFSLSIEGKIDVQQSTISAYRGMEKPIVIVVACSQIDDVTLACALGRATTRAYIIVPVEFITDLSGLKSYFLRKGLKKIDREKILEKDACDAEPKFIENKVLKFAGAIGRHEIFGERFFYASRWRRWVYEGGPKWNNRGVQLWGAWLSLSTSCQISGIDSLRNELTNGYLYHCSKCNTTTPHDVNKICLTCLVTPLDEGRVAKVVRQAEEFGRVRSRTVWQSILNVAMLVGDFRFPRLNDNVCGEDEFPLLILATTIVEFRMRRKATVAIKSQIEEWLREVLVSSDLNKSIKDIAGRAISSLCAQKILRKIGHGRYSLIREVDSAV